MEDIMEKTSHVDYFRIMKKNGNDEKIEYDLTELMKNLEPKKPNARTVQISKLEYVRLQSINYDSLNNLWEMMFLRIRKDFISGKATDTGELKALGLNKNEGLAESNSVVYDPSLSIIAIQRSRDGIYPSTVETFLHFFLPDDIINLDVITLEFDIKRLKSKTSLIRKFEIGVAGLSKQTVADGFFGNFFKCYTEYKPDTIQITLGVGHAPISNSLDKELSNQLIDEFSKEKGVTKFNVSYYKDPDSYLEKVDLLNNKIRDEITVEYTVNENPHLYHQSVISGIKQAYMVRKKAFQSKLS